MDYLKDTVESNQMRQSMIKNVEWHLGVHLNEVNLLKVNAYQVMNFTADDDGPICLSESDWQLLRYDTDTGKIEQVKYRACKLVKKLKEEKNMTAKVN